MRSWRSATIKKGEDHVLLRIMIGFFLTALMPMTSLAGLGQWTGNGPYGGEVRCIAFDPFAPDTVYVGLLSNGVYKSVDGGSHWIPLRPGG